MHDALGLLRPLAVSRGVTLQSNVSEAAHTYVLADRQRLKQVFVNLLSNAVKYNRPAGQVTIT